MRDQWHYRSLDLALIHISHFAGVVLVWGLWVKRNCWYVYNWWYGNWRSMQILESWSTLHTRCIQSPANHVNSSPHANRREGRRHSENHQTRSNFRLDELQKPKKDRWDKHILIIWNGNFSGNVIRNHHLHILHLHRNQWTRLSLLSIEVYFFFFWEI